MRIALIGPAHPYKGGGARHTTELAHHLAAAGHDVVIESWRALYPAALYPGVQTVEVPEGEPYPCTRRLLSWRRPDGWLAAGRRLRADRDLVVLTFLTPIQVPAYLGILRGLRGWRGLRRLRRRPGGSPAATPRPVPPRAVPPRAGAPQVVVICHNVLPHERRPGDVLLTRSLLRRADAVITHTERLASVARCLAPVTPVTVAAMPPHLPGTPERARDEDARTVPATAEAGYHLLFFGIVRPYKGLEVLLRAMAQAPAELTLTVAGEFWGGTDATRDLVSALGLNGRVDLRPGYVPADEIGKLLRTADALVLPYRSATASQNAWLAFEYGVPVIATRTGTFAEQVSDGVDGLLCEPGEVASLAGALTRFCVPGVRLRLRAGVRPVAAPALWAAYLDALLAAGRRAAVRGQ
jgi:glycosyltransferase involved in cell wall biosynthesis